MIKSILVLENGTEISAGAMETNAIQNVSVEESCNDGEDLSFGSVCAKKITVNIITPKNKVPISAGEKIILYEEESGVRRKKGVFNAEKPQKKNSNTTKLEAYDNISLLDKDVTEWFNTLDGFPYTAFNMAKMTCEYCGVGFSNSSITNGDFPINKTELESVTGRQIIRWIGEICGCFCVSDENGNATYRWYKENNTTITADGSEGSVIFLQGTLSYEDYEVKGVDRVQIQQGSEDLGISYPENLEGGNVYKISANPFLMVSEESAIKTIAQSLYDAVKNQIYTPCRVRVPASFKFDVGDIVRIEDANGVIIKSYIMRRNRNGNVENIECTGNYERNGATSLYNTDFSSQYGTTLTIRKGLGELRIRAERADRALSEYKIEVSDTYATQSMLTEYKNDASEALAEYKTEVSDTYATQSMLTEYKDEVSEALTSITETADKDRSAIELLVEYDSDGNPKTSADLLIEAINDESEVKIRADKVNLEGYVTVSSLGEDGTTIIDGSRIQTGQIQSLNYVVDESGTMINLETGIIDSKNFKVDEEGNVTILGKGMIGKDVDVYGTLRASNISAYTDNTNNETARIYYDNGYFYFKCANSSGSSEAGVSIRQKSSTTIEMYSTSNSGTARLGLSSGGATLYSPSFMTISSNSLTLNPTTATAYGHWSFQSPIKAVAGIIVNTSSAGEGIKFYQNRTSNITNAIRRNSDTATRLDIDGNWYSAGTWEFSSSPIITSDRNRKHDIKDMPSEYGILFDNLRPVIHKYDNGTSDRYHTAFIAQEVDEAITKAGLTRKDFAGLCIENEGKDSELWSLRYSEFIALNTFEIQNLKKRFSELEELIKLQTR